MAKVINEILLIHGSIERYVACRSGQKEQSCTNGKPSGNDQIVPLPASVTINSLDVQMRNLYGTDDRNITPYGQLFKKNHLHEIVTELARSSDFSRRLAAIETANKTDKLWLHRPGTFAGEVRHLVHDEVSESRQRPGQHVSRRNRFRSRPAAPKWAKA